MPKSIPPYPWGYDKPSSRLRLVSTRLRQKINKADKTEYPQIQERVNDVVAECRNLVLALDHLTRAGLVKRNNPGQRLSHAEVTEVLNTVQDNLSELATSSVNNLSPHYATFLSATESLLNIADRAMTQGIVPSGSDPTDTVWNRFQT